MNAHEGFVSAAIFDQPGVVHQFGALPWRRDRQGNVRILMITSRRRGRWIVPKGSLINGRTPAQSAAREAFEEAGVFGDMHPAPIGSYIHGRDLEDGCKPLFRVTLFALRVRATLLQWPEKHQRTRSWQSLSETVEKASEPDFARLLQSAAEELSIFNA
ncbi:NUDIX hydrolase [Rhizobium sp. 18065]|uniref:NUDIX hydrolase n=1 Tax=Rhizobium sp. 18065 TaxID=2681411 RepID=UPI001357B829|nr:NUDIX hydrolase [Rhizobium sp. 18065]